MLSPRIKLAQNRGKKISRVFLLIISIGFLLTISKMPQASAQEPVPTPIIISDDQVNLIAREMYCPVCENIPLDVCSTQACAEWRELIREKLAEGWSKEQIGDYFIERFGDRVSSTPPLRGINWLIYIAPPVAFILSAVILFRTIKRSHRNNLPDHMNVTYDDESHDLYMERLEEELKKL